MLCFLKSLKGYLFKKIIIPSGYSHIFNEVYTSTTPSYVRGSGGIKGWGS